MMQLMRESSRVPPLSQHSNGLGPYVFKGSLGQGTTGTVRLACNTSNGTNAAVKIVNKTITRKKKEAEKEIKVLANVVHPHIIKLEHVEEDLQNIYIFTEYCEEGDLYAYIQKNGLFDEHSAKALFRQMLEAVEFCHRTLRICHHDLKLENLVVNSQMQLKLIDFGFAVSLDNAAGKKMIKLFDSSPAYSPLEILLRRPHDESVDIYSLGTCLYFMLCGCFPYCDPDKATLEELCQQVATENVTFPRHLSSSVQDLLRRMLAQRKSRISCEEIRYHAWLNDL